LNITLIVDIALVLDRIMVLDLTTEEDPAVVQCHLLRHHTDLVSLVVHGFSNEKILYFITIEW